VMDRSRIVHSQFARHTPTALSLGLSVKAILYNSRETDPFARVQTKGAPN
jgi:hypothetical protein